MDIGIQKKIPSSISKEGICYRGQVSLFLYFLGLS